MDLKLLLLFLFVTVATSSKCGWKKSAYVGTMFELMWNSDKETVCKAVTYFNQRMEKKADCFDTKEKLIFEALKESCGSICKLQEVVRKGKSLAFRINLNIGTAKACASYQPMKHLLTKQKCPELYEVLRKVLFYCDDEVENPFDLMVDISSKAKNENHISSSNRV